MTEFVARAFEVALTEQAVAPLEELFELTGKSYSQVCKDGLERAVQNLPADETIQIPEEWKLQPKSEFTRQVLRLPTEVLMSLDDMARRSQTSWGELASYLTECEVYHKLVWLREM